MYLPIHIYLHTYIYIHIHVFTILDTYISLLLYIYTQPPNLQYYLNLFLLSQPRTPLIHFQHTPQHAASYIRGGSYLRCKFAYTLYMYIHISPCNCMYIQPLNLHQCPKYLPTYIYLHTYIYVYTYIYPHTYIYVKIRTVRGTKVVGSGLGCIVGLVQ